MKVIASLLFLFCCATCGHSQVESLKIGRGDELQIKVLEAPELAQTARVNDAGTVTLLLGGDVHVVGLTPVEAAHAIERVLVDGHYLLTPHVNIAFAVTVTQNVSVVGQVRSPGSYPIGTPRPVLDVLALAGGLTDIANRKVTIQRHASKERIEFVLSNSPDAALDGNVSIFPGDTLIIPKADIVYILGDVGRPGGIAMVTNDSKLSALQAISLAGGTPPSAAPAHARLIRKQPDGTHADLPLQLKAMQQGKQPDIPLQADDIVYVPFSYARNLATGSAGGLISSTSSAAIYKF